jgi:pyridoxamine 5'-phosphate oxidase
MSSLRERLRALPSIVGSSPPLDTTHNDPRTLMVQFLTEAIEAGVPEPHAITLVTVDSSNRPDARVLIIKDIDENGDIAIATSSKSAKGIQLSENPQVALSWYCTPHARAIRIRGTASLADSDVSKADFQARSVKAKAIAMAGTQSSPVPRGTNRAALIDDMKSKLEETGDVDSTEWQVWMITPEEVEFWQGAKDRNHDRLKYKRTEGGWERTTLWP